MSSRIPAVRTAPTLTLGIEEEFQVLDPDTLQLRSHLQAFFEQGHLLLAEKMKKELHQSVVEIGTGVCKDIAEARRDVMQTRRVVYDLAARNGLLVAAAGTHPFSHWADVAITSSPRYDQIISDLQVVARANLIFGLHVHVGVEDREVAIQIMNAARYFLPHVYALSVNSPFWLGRETGWKSYRSKIFDKFPRTGMPDYFSSWSEFDNHVKLLIKTNCIDTATKIWWDVRPHPLYPTLEFRICDIPMRVNETICFAAIFQAIVAKLYKLYSQNLGFRLYRRSLINENKWRAARWGTEAKLIDFGRQEELPYPFLLEELLAFIDDVVDELGSRKEVEYARTIVREGTGADRQLKVWRETGDLKKVAECIVYHTQMGIGD
ncbi:MAG: carboxylate-amine ligase [Planctomycetes bacterium]|nr:carboxylate-amine ligase [Planctomycetota bacterium]